MLHRGHPMRPSRRALLQGAGALLGTVPLRANAADATARGAVGGTVSPVMARLSAYMGEARDRALPDGIVR